MPKPAKAAARSHAAPSPATERSLHTRASLVEAATRVFNDVGYWGTDSNALARAAGYSPGTFYRHFVDKRAIFIACYEAWAAAEDERLGAHLTRARDRGEDVAGAFVDFMLSHHQRWRTFRASLRALVEADAALQKAVRAHRRRHLEMLRDVVGDGDPVKGLLLLYTLEGLSDALAANEPRQLGVAAKTMTEQVRGMVVRG